MSSTAMTRADARAEPRWYERPRNFFVGVLGIYAVARLFSAIVLYLVGLHQVDVVWFDGETGYLRMTVLWDAFWYRQIVEDGYPAILPHDPDTGKLWQNPWAFYPMFPMLTRFVMNLTGAGFALAGSTISLLFGGLAAVLMSILLRDKVGPRVALVAVAIWATCITSPTLQVAYTESIALVFLCGVLLALTKERWWLAAGIAFLSGLSRPITLPIGLVALICVFLRWRRREAEPIPVREYVAMFGSLVGCGLSGFVWPLIVWRGTGNIEGYTQTMTAWRVYDEIQPFVPLWNWAMSVVHAPAAAALLLFVIAVAVVGIVAGPWARALGPQLRAWCLAYPLYLAAVLDPTTSIFRYVICFFPWAVVMVGAGWGPEGAEAVAEDQRGGRRRGGARAAVLRRGMRGVRGGHVMRWAVVWIIFNLITQSWWVWEIWQFTPPADNPP